MIYPTLTLDGIPEIDAAVEGLVGVNVAQMRRERFPPLYRSGIRYQREATERWLPASKLRRTLRGDCEDLAAYRAAELRVSGTDPYASVRVYPSRAGVLHAVVRRGDGSVEDPSRLLGMRSPEEELGFLDKLIPGLSQMLSPGQPGSSAMPQLPSGLMQMLPGLVPGLPKGMFSPGAPLQMPVPQAGMLPGGINPMMALQTLQSGMPLGIQAGLRQLPSGLFQGTVAVPGMPAVRATAATPQQAGGGVFGALARLTSNPAIMSQIPPPYGPAVAAGTQVLAALAKDKGVKKALKWGGKAVETAAKAIWKSKPVKALGKLFGL